MGELGFSKPNFGNQNSRSGFSSSSIDISSLPSAGKQGDDPSIDLPDDLIDGCLGEWKFSLFGRLDFQKLKFEIAMKCLKEQWVLTGNCQLIPLGKGFFVIKLENEEDKNYVRHQKSWKVEEQYVRIKDWEPNFKPENQRISTAFVWVHFPGLCLEFWEEKIVMAIAKGVGRPVLVDDATLKKQFGYYANVLVEVDFDKPIPDKIWIKSKLGCFYQTVEIPKSPKFCNHCKIIGHLVAECRAVREVNRSDSKEVAENNPGKLLNANTYKRRKKNNKSKEMPLNNLEEGEIECDVAAGDGGIANITSQATISYCKNPLLAKAPIIAMSDRQDGTNKVVEVEKVIPSRQNQSVTSMSLPLVPSCVDTFNRFHGLGVEEEVATSQSSVSECRQKTMEFMVACKNPSKPCSSEKRRNEPCTLKFCHKCLTNRYGEKAEEVSLLEGWHCPKCRGICNCSFCRKKNGDVPTGMLIHKAKATGFESVSQLLSLGGPDCVVSLKKEASKSRRGKENSHDVNMIPDLNEKPSESESDRDSIKESNYGGAIVSSPKRNFRESMHGGDISPETKKSKKSRVSKVDDEKMDETKTDEINDTLIHNAEFETPLPQGVELTTVAGIALPSEDVGHALQFLEFCNAFEQVLDLKKGQPESILQELLTNGCSSRSPGECSLVIQMHIQLLSLIQKDTGEESTCPSSGDNTWLQALGKCVAESNYALKEFPSTDSFEKDGDAYNKLELSQKLRLLNFLCDETLGTTTMRKWVDNEKDRCIERVQKAKEKVDAAKKEEEELILKIRNEVAKSVIESGDSVSSEHAERISKLQAEAAKVHAEKLEAKRMVPKNNQRSHAYRTEPILLEGDGHTFWSLKSHSSRSTIMLQDVGSWDSDTPGDKWFSYDCEQRTEVEDYISSIRRRRLRLQHEDADRDK